MVQSRSTSLPLPIRRHYLPFGRPDFGPQEIAAVTHVLQSGCDGMGREVIPFEQPQS